ncbi:uncharacterized protein [Solanum lycopersicum]|uniref:uncharacterized protein n=1 Tax=Solanum lycopersicum TaxID=4081 RepID=UPI003747E6DD
MSMQLGKSNTLMLSPLPSVYHAYSLLMQDEKQREVYMSSQYLGNSASFLATNQTILDQKSGYYEAKQKKTILVCSNCKKLGHSVDKCYRIIGFPSDFKFTKSKRFQGNVKSNVVFMEGTQEQNGAHFNGDGQGKHFTKDQYSQLIQMLQNVQMNQPEESPCDAAANAVTCAGNVFKSPYKIVQFKHQTWILDSGATQHMCFDSKIFLELRNLQSPIFVDLPNSYKVKGPSMKRPLEFGEVRISLYLLKSSFQYLKGFDGRAIDLSEQENSSCLSVSSTFPVPIKSYPCGKKGYRVLDLKTQKIMVSRNVKFHENTYPSSVISTSQTPSSTSIFAKDTSIIQDSQHDNMSAFHNLSDRETYLTPQHVDAGSTQDNLETGTSPDTLEINTSTSTVIPRRSDRTHNRPTYLEEYVCNAVFLANLTETCFSQSVVPNCYFFASLSTSNQQVLNSISNITEPTSYAQAELHPGWQLAMETEIAALIENDT